MLISFNNCCILYDPERKIDKQILIDFIDNNKNDKIVLYSFIVNTCTLISNISKSDIEAVSHLYKHMDE